MKAELKRICAGARASFAANRAWLLKGACAVLLALGGALGALADARVLDGVVQQDVKVGGYWRREFRKLSVEWLPHCIRQMQKGGRGEELLNLVATADLNAGRAPGVKFKGCPWSDAYPYNIAESICLALEIDPGPDEAWRANQRYLRQVLEGWIELFLAAQEPTGYIHSFHALRGQKHFTRYHDHEFYVMAYFLEMGVAHMRMTCGTDRRLFTAAKKCADHIDSIFGPAPKRTWVNGCPSIEMALLRLADACERWDGAGTGLKYARLAQFFVRSQHLGVKGEPKLVFPPQYCQAERPAEEMTEATGHAVRACYFYTAMAGVASRLHDRGLERASDAVFANAVHRKAYVTGGVGSTAGTEAFGRDFELPLDGYCEACAACSMSFWCLERHAHGKGAITEDVRERLLYNAVGGAVSEDGRNFLYRNPPNGRERHYPWHPCPCCVGNIPRTLFALKDTMYSFARDGKTLWVEHFVDAESDVTLGGRKYHLKMATAYPANGGVTLEITPKPAFALVVRFPDRAESRLYTAEPAVEHGYRALQPFDVTGRTARYAWSLPMPLQRVKADARVEACRGRTALQRGPVVYAHEGPWGDEVVPFSRRLMHGGLSSVWKRDADAKPAGGFSFRTWDSVAEYRDFEILAPDGSHLRKGFPALSGCRALKDGRWTLRDGVLRQSNPSSHLTQLTFGRDAPWRDCTVRFKARRLGGEHGFTFHVRDESDERFVMLNLGGWRNRKHALEVRGHACHEKEVVMCAGTLETGRWYEVEIACVGDLVGVKLDGRTLFAPVSIP